jgi:putative ABC transport system ATP-binding protein
VSRISIALSGVRKVYHAGRPEEVRALDGVDLELPPGAFVSVEGPSGCGKTTLLNLLGLLDVPSEGVVRWDGRDVSTVGERQRARDRLLGVGFIFQRFYLLPTLSARENVELPLRARRVPKGARRERAELLLAEVGLERRSEAYPHELSGGEEQRVAIARALANEPPLLLADEPTGELDSQNATKVLELLVALRASHGSTLVLVTHNPEVAARAERHLLLKDGRVVGDRREA